MPLKAIKKLFQIMKFLIDVALVLLNDVKIRLKFLFEISMKVLLILH